MATVLANGSLSSNSPARATSAARWSKTTSSSASSRCPASCSTPCRSPSACGSSRRTRPPEAKSEQPQRNRQGEMLFIDARDLGHMEDRTHRNLAAEDIATIADTYHSWRGEPDPQAYQDVPGFLRLSQFADSIAEHDSYSPRDATSAPKTSKTTANLSTRRSTAS
ncbi:MAG: N-6 DNA methylase [Candidatus Nanopelagicales bacterium]